MKVLVGTNKPKKLQVVKDVCSHLLQTDTEVIGYAASSQVPEAPHGEETYRGALNRATECASIGGADFFVGIESGLASRYGNDFEEAWAVVIWKGRQYVGYSSGLLLPKVVTSRMAAGLLHNEVMEQLDKELNLPEDNRDTWSRYSGGQILRTISLEESLRNALIQIVPAKDSLYSLQ